MKVSRSSPSCGPTSAPMMRSSTHRGPATGREARRCPRCAVARTSMRRRVVERIHARVQLHGFAISQSLRTIELSRRRQHCADQALDFGHQRVMVEPEAVPLDHRELGVVPAAALAAAVHTADLPDVAAARGEQALHRVLGRGVQEPDAAPAAIASTLAMCTSVTGPHSTPVFPLRGCASRRSIRAPRAASARALRASRSRLLGANSRHRVISNGPCFSGLSRQRSGDGPAELHGRLGDERSVPADPVALEQQDDRRAHVEATQLRALGELPARGPSGCAPASCAGAAAG